MKSISTMHHITTNDFSPINNAVDLEIQKRQELTQLYSSQRRMNGATIFLYVCAALCLLIVTICLIYWFFFNQPEIRKEPPLKNEEA
jgi:hypothetical protein